MRIAVVLVAGLLSLSACNTVEGVARDVQGAGEVLEDSARKTKKAITN